MPRISNLQTIKNEALAKLNTFHNLIDGRTDAALRRKIYSTGRKDTALKLLNEISAIPLAIPVAKTESPAKKVTAIMITKVKSTSNLDYSTLKDFHSCQLIKCEFFLNKVP